jgi:hypothetical protein
MRTARNAHWELVADSAALTTTPVPAVQVNNAIVIGSGANPYAD